jgi:hypothetical protein
MMKTLTIETEVQTDGRLHLDLPTNLAPGKVEVVLVIQPQEPSAPPYPTLEGRWRDWFPTDFDLDSELQEIRHAWEHEWEGPA